MVQQMPAMLINANATDATIIHLDAVKPQWLRMQRMSNNGPDNAGMANDQDVLAVVFLCMLLVSAGNA